MPRGMVMLPGIGLDRFTLLTSRQILFVDQHQQVLPDRRFCPVMPMDLTLPAIHSIPPIESFVAHQWIPFVGKSKCHRSMPMNN